jgi:D-sedoheptulose 7-phosphate isomerase
MEMFKEYSRKISVLLDSFDWTVLTPLGEELFRVWKARNSVYICGNGGSAGNSNHIANDFTYGIAPQGKGLNIESLSANSSVITCLANDLSYVNIFSWQVKVKSRSGDILIVMSGSGNSANIIEALVTAKKLGVKTFAILGYDGGKAKDLADHVIHFQVDDMQIVEDCQLVVFHMVMKYLKEKIANA